MILVTGFGEFLDVRDNPSSRLARAVDGAVVEGPDGPWPVVGREIAVSYQRGVAETVALARSLGARLVIGTGVARQRDEVDVERLGFAGGDATTPDVDGVCRPAADGQVRATIDTGGFAAAMGARCSDDAGRYVCNGWLHDVVLGLPGVPVGFVHMSPAGMSPERLLRGLGALAHRHGRAAALQG